MAGWSPSRTWPTSRAAPTGTSRSQFADRVDPDEFRRLPGVIDLEADGRRIAFKATGDLDAVIKTAARHTVTDIELVRPTLEEVFLTYYGTRAT